MKPSITAVLLTVGLLMVGLTIAGPAAAATWRIDHDNSRLGFTATQSGAEFSGVFQRFQAEMRFDPDDLDNAGFDVTVDVTSFDSNSRDRDQTVAGKEWFWFKRFPEARFVTTAFRRTGPQAFEADGDLTIKGIGQSITLPFTWTIDGDVARMDGRVTLVRTRFNVGEGEWSDGDTVGKQVDVHVDLKLDRVTP